MKRLALIGIPWLLVALFALEIVLVMLPKKDGEYHVREFGRLPVLLGGRIQPFDSVAHNSLLEIRSTGDVPLEIVPSWKFWHHPKKLKSTEWLLEVMARPDVADTRPVFLIHFADLLSELKLQNKGIEKSGLRYYTFEELRPAIPEIGKQAQRVLKREEDKLSSPEHRSVFEKNLMKLYNAAMIYQRLKFTLQPEGAENFAEELAQFKRDLPAAQLAAQAADSTNDVNKQALERIAQPLRDFQTMAEFGYPLIAPPLTPDLGRDHWLNAGNALLESVRNNGIHLAVGFYAEMATAYAQQKPAEFNKAVAGYEDWLQPQFAHELKKGRAEFYYNNVKAFLHASIIYICAFILALLAILNMSAFPGPSESLRRSAFYLVLLAGVVHTFGLIFRMVLEGRPPVTNLYSSAIFIGWATMVFGVAIEMIYRVGIGSLVASLAGFVTLLIAHNLALGSGDTMEMLRAVLDTNFWLATHVVVITLGYASTFFAGVLAILYIFLGLLTPLLKEKIGQLGTMQPANIPLKGAAKSSAATTTKKPADLELGKALGKMVYGVICFATLFSFVGTVLGGIWADQSWGRFWGWDPKENGALMIVLWNALILHARWGGLIRERGLMNLAVFGNIVTSFSWFGVNMLGIGLHSYGFMDAAFIWLMAWIVGNLIIIGFGLLPLHFWSSFQSQDSTPPSALGKPSSQPA